MTNLDGVLKSKDITLPIKVCNSQSYGFSNSHVWMWELDHKESWVPKNWCFWTMVLEKTLESPLDYKEIQPVYPKGNQSWIFIGRTDADDEAPILWPSNVKNWLVRKDPDAGKDWRQEVKGKTEDEMVGWHHRIIGYEFEQAPRDGEGSLACCSPWGCKVGHNWTNELNWTEKLRSFPQIWKVLLQSKITKNTCSFLVCGELWNFTVMIYWIIMRLHHI